MQTPMFSPDLPEYVSYGGLGSIIGHELTHAVDAGAQEIEAGGLSTRWWDNVTTANYEKKASCFVKQYGNYTFKDEKGGLEKVSGEATMEENIADGVVSQPRTQRGSNEQTRSRISVCRA